MNLSDAWKLAKDIGKVVVTLIPPLRKFRRDVDALPPTEPDSVPLPFRDLEHQRAQIDAATSHKVKR